MPADPIDTETVIPRRQAVMAVCAESRSDELDEVLAGLRVGDVRDLRSPSAGLVMLRGRIGGDGRAFNVGEATVARATVVLADGHTGFAYHLGRDLKKARAAAVIDALWQGEAREAVEAALAPIRDRLAAERKVQADRTAATRVNFFTLVRGEG